MIAKWLLEYEQLNLFEGMFETFRNQAKRPKMIKMQNRLRFIPNSWFQGCFIICPCFFPAVIGAPLDTAHFQVENFKEEARFVVSPPGPVETMLYHPLWRPGIWINRQQWLRDGPVG